MAGYRTIGQLMQTIGGASSSKHRTARVLRFVFRHRDSHGHITGQLRRDQQRRNRRARRRFERMQRG